MKKYIYSLFMVFLAAATMTSCTEDEGTEPGNDPTPVITVYQYNATKPNNPDNDVVIRFATNSKVAEVYYIAEKTADKDAYIKTNGENSYLDYVIEKGTKLTDISGASNVDVTITDLYGEYTITAVALGGNAKASAKTVFTGLEWTDVVAGTYQFSKVSAPLSGTPSTPTVLQVCTTDANLYRFKDVFGTGYHMKINLINFKGTDEDGEYQFFRVPVVETPFTFKDKGNVSLRDIGYWQGNDAFVTEGGYESGMYANYFCFIYVQYFVEAGSFGFDYDFFIPN